MTEHSSGWAVPIAGSLSALFGAAVMSWYLSLFSTSAPTPERPLSAAVDLCAAQLPITHGRLLKTQGEVASWREAKDGGMDLFLVKEIDGGASCGMKAHLPPTIPETTWRPVSGERVTVCGLVVQGKQRPLMVATWRCL